MTFFFSGDSLLKKIFSLEYSDNNAKLKLILKDLVDKVKQDPYDNSSPEVESRFFVGLKIFFD